jgi:hypothetical protein
LLRVQRTCQQAAKHTTRHKLQQLQPQATHPHTGHSPQCRPPAPCRPDAKNALYQATIKQGDLLLNRLQKLSKVIDIE